MISESETQTDFSKPVTDLCQIMLDLIFDTELGSEKISLD